MTNSKQQACPDAKNQVRADVANIVTELSRLAATAKKTERRPQPHVGSDRLIVGRGK